MNTHWSDIYPHDIWTNILVFRGKVIDYKIGGDKRDWESWTFAWDEDIVENKEALHVIQFREAVSNAAEHTVAFEKGLDMVDEVVTRYGKYEYV